MSLENLSNWKANFPNKQNVQPDEHEGALNGAYLSGESAVIVSGPPVLSGSAASLYPIGLVQSAQLQQNKQLNEIFEIGGRTPFFIPARVRVRASLSRVLFDGPSLFYAMYERESNDGGTPTVPSSADFGSGSSHSLNNPTMPYPDSGIIDTQSESQNANPGKFWGNLGSAIFNRPLGLGFVLFDMDGEPYGGVYLEKCYIQSHSFGISANATVLAENVTLSASRVKPLDASGL
jgi:hypothetical protein